MKAAPPFPRRPATLRRMSARRRSGNAGPLPSAGTSPPVPAGLLAVVLAVSLTVMTGCAASAPRGAKPSAPPPPAKPRRIVLLTWDGTPKWLVDRMLADGELPHLASLIKDGTAAAYTTSNFPNSTTPPGHAALFTGCYGVDNGITGFHIPRVPMRQHTLAESQIGFDSRLLKAEPFWVTVARAGGSAALLHAPHCWPPEPFGEWKTFGGDFGAKLSLLSGYSGTQLAREGLVDRLGDAPPDGWWKGAPVAPAGRAWKHADLRIGTGARAVTVRVLLFDDPADPVDGLDTAAVSCDGDFARAAKLKPLPVGRPDAWGAVALPGRPLAGVPVRLLALSPDGSAFRVMHGPAWEPATNLAPDRAADLMAKSGWFLGNGAGYAVRQGRLGKKLSEGGDGSAEALYLETVDVMARHQEGCVAWALRELPDARVVVGYIPVPDEAGHNWAGWCEPGGPAYDAAMAGKLEPVLRAALRRADGMLGVVRAAAGPDTVVAVSSDHGMRGTARVVRPNVLLAGAGLLKPAAGGTGIDLSATKAAFHPAGHGYVCVNGTDRAGGIVPPEQRDAVLAAAKRVLTDARDGEGRPLFRHVWDADPPEGRLGLGLETTGDLFLVPADGCKLLTDANGPVEGPAAPDYTGNHDCLPDDAPLRTLFVLAGPGVARGRSVGPVRHVDVAPTLLRLLDVPPGPKVTGRVLTEVLAD